MKETILRRCLRFFGESWHKVKVCVVALRTSVNDGVRFVRKIPWRVKAWFGRRVAALKASDDYGVRLVMRIPWPRLCSILLLVLALIVLVGCVGWRLWDSEQDGVYPLRSPLITAGAALLAASVAACFFAWRNWIAGKELQEERYGKGVEFLGHESPVVRIGGLYALHQLAEDFSEKWALPVLELMCIFVRTSPRDEDKAEGNGKKPLRRDVEEAVQLLGLRGLARREEEERERKKVKKEGKGKSPGRGNLDFRKADLVESSWIGVDLGGANFSGATLTGANFREAGLEKAIFSEARLDGARFDEATLTEANFREAKLEKANFEGATLTDANFLRATLTEASFDGATLTRAFFNGATLTEASFDGATLEGANFWKATLEGASFFWATLTEVLFREATLEGVDFLVADITGADFSGANLSGVILLTHFEFPDEDTPLPPVSGVTREQLEKGWIEPGRLPVKIVEGKDEDGLSKQTTMDLTEADWKEIGLDPPPIFKVGDPQRRRGL